MAFSNAPSQDTYSTARIPVVHDIESTNGSGFLTSALISGMFNVLPFKDKDGELYGETRNFFKVHGVLGGTSTCRGMYVWEKSAGETYFFMVIDGAVTSTVYTSSTSPRPTSSSDWTNIFDLPTKAATPVRFTEFINDSGVKSLVMVDGVDGYVFTDDNSYTHITDADFPSPHVPFPVFVDGYLFLAKADTGDIYNSNLNDPTAWTAGSFISSELYPDDIQALVKVDNYILAVGVSGSEYFYDAANATASPLARVPNGNLPFGTSFPNSIANTKNMVMFLANDGSSEASLKLIEGTKYSDVPSKVLIETLKDRLDFGFTAAEYVRGCFVRQNDGLFYVFQFDGQRFPDGTAWEESVYYSLNCKLWGVLNWGSNSAMYPMVFTAPATSENAATFLAGHIDNYGAVFGWNDLLITGDYINGGSAPGSTVQEVYIPPQTFGTYNRKFMSRLGLYTYGASGTVNYPTVYWNDNTPASGNWQGGRTLVTNADGNQGDDLFPFITQLGQFRKRAFKITFVGAAKWYYIEVDINKGQQ